MLGTDVTVYSDHKPLIDWNKRQAISTRHSKWLNALADYTFTIHHVAGKNNVIADMLSRPRLLKCSETGDERQISAISLLAQNEELAQEQTKDLIDKCRRRDRTIVQEEGIWLIKNGKHKRIIISDKLAR